MRFLWEIPKAVSEVSWSNNVKLCRLIIIPVHPSFLCRNHQKDHFAIQNNMVISCAGLQAWWERNKMGVPFSWEARKSHWCGGKSQQGTLPGQYLGNCQEQDLLQESNPSFLTAYAFAENLNKPLSRRILPENHRITLKLWRVKQINYL